MRPAFHHQFESGAQRHRRLAGAGPAAERDDADLVVHQQVEGDPLFGGPAAQPEGLPLAADQPDLLARGDPAQRRTRRGDQLDAGVAGQLPGLVGVDQPGVEQGVHLLGGHLQFGHPGPAGRHDVLRPVLVGGQPDRRRLDPQRHVLGDQGDPAGGPFQGQVQRAGQNPRVVAVIAESGRQHGRVGVVQLDVQGAAGRADRDRGVQPAVFDPEFVQDAQRLPGEVAELRMVPLGLEFADHDQRQDDLVLVEPVQRPGIGQQDRGVDDVGEPVAFRLVLAGRRIGDGARAACCPPRPGIWRAGSVAVAAR